MSWRCCVVLEALSPLERAVFVLHEAFDYEHPEVARILGRTEPAVRQLLKRARDHVADPAPLRHRPGHPAGGDRAVPEGLPGR